METLCKIIEELRLLGFNYHVYFANDCWHCDGRPLINAILSNHKIWYDEISDQRVDIHCVTSGEIKGVGVT